MSQLKQDKKLPFDHTTAHTLYTHQYLNIQLLCLKNLQVKPDAHGHK